jgi:hypothetical protein
VSNAIEQESIEYVDEVLASSERRAAALAKQSDAARTAVNKFYMSHNFTFESSKTDCGKAHATRSPSSPPRASTSRRRPARIVASTGARAESQRDFVASHTAQLRSLHGTTSEFTARLTPLAATGETPIKQPLNIVRSSLPLPKRADIVAGCAAQAPTSRRRAAARLRIATRSTSAMHSRTTKRAQCSTTTASR